MMVPAQRAARTWALLGALAGAGLMLVAAPAAAETLRSEKTVKFLGFSGDQKRGAWFVQVERYASGARGRYVDRYALVRIVNAHNNDMITSYRVGKIQRTDIRGGRLLANSESLMTENPPWATAGPAADWKLLEREFQFEAARISAATAVAFVPDPDVDLTAMPAGSGMVRLDANSNILGYTLAMADRHDAVLGRYRHVAKADQHVTSLLEVLVSPKGDYVAVVNRFEIIGAADDEPSAVTYGKIIPVSTEARNAGKEIYVRTLWGWNKMTPEEEKIWRERRQENLDFAEMLNAYANGSL